MENPTEVRKKENMDWSQQSTETRDLSEEELHEYIEEIYIEEGKPMTLIPKYIPLCKPTTKVPKDPDNTKFMVTMPLLSKKVVFESAYLAHI